jgi:hypothetical protein
MTFDSSKPVQTRDGRKARIICTDLKRKTGETILAAYDDGEGFELECAFYADGRFSKGGLKHQFDLINVPEMKSFWANVYGSHVGGLWDSRSAADGMCSRDRLNVIELLMCNGKLIDAIQHEVEK